MKLPMPSAQEIQSISERADHAIYMCDGDRTATKHIVENAIRNALAIVVDRMDIQIPQPIGLDLSKS